MRRVVLGGGVLALLLIGCGPPRPTLAGGKPVSHWLQALQQPDAKVRKTAVIELGNVGMADPAALPAVIDALKDADAAVRREAILALLKSKSAAGAAVPALTEMQHSDPDETVRAYAAAALTKLQDGK